MSSFEPIAIIGQGCVLPGAHTPETLTNLVMDRKVVYGAVPPEDLGLIGAAAENRHFVSGHIQGFDNVFEPERARLKSVNAAELDPVCRWPLKAALDAWANASRPKVKGSALGVFVANLSYPSAGHVGYASSIWRGEEPPPAHMALN